MNINPRVRIAIHRLQAGHHTLALINLNIGGDDLAAVVAALRNNATLTTLYLGSNNLGDEGARSLAAALNATLITSLNLADNNIGAEGAQSLAAALNATLITSLYLGSNNIGAEGARSLASALNATRITTLYLGGNNIGAEGARSLAAALARNATRITRLNLDRNNIGPVGARYLAAALNTTRITSLDLYHNNIGAEGARSLAAALDNNSTLTSLDLGGANEIGVYIQNLVGDRLRVNKLVPKVAMWVTTTAARVKPLDNTTRNNLPPDFAASAAVLAFGNELLDLQLPDDRNNNLWRSPGGRDLAAVYLLPRAETALCRELQRLAMLG